MKNYSSSELAFIQALSALAVAAAGSTNPIDLSEFEFANFVVATNSADLTVNVERSSASNGTFGQVGLSMAGNPSGLAVRGCTLQGSPNWYRVSYDNNNSGSATTSIFIVATGAGRTPITQDSNTSTYSTLNL